MKLSLTKIAFLNYRILRRTVWKPYIVWIMSKMILLYQKYLSRHTCLYHPTCSQYMLESLNRFGCIFGLLLGCFRILRCNPFSKGGYDPVPENYFLYRWVI